MMADIYKAASEVTKAVNDLIQPLQADPSSAGEVVRGSKLSEWSATWMFLQSTYWTRLWVVQEILLAKALALWSDLYIMSWHDFCLP
jgi:hypothetical protein